MWHWNAWCRCEAGLSRGATAVACHMPACMHHPDGPGYAWAMDLNTIEHHCKVCSLSVSDMVYGQVMTTNKSCLVLHCCPLLQCLTPDPHAWAQRQSLLSEHIQCLRQAWKGFHDIRWVWTDCMCCQQQNTHGSCRRPLHMCMACTAGAC